MELSGIKSDLIRQVSRLPKVTESDRDIITAFKAGDREAGFKLFRKHYKMVLKVILDCTRGKWFSDDCLQAGAVGLYEGAMRFDLTRDTKFLTYSVWWIRKKVMEEVCNDVLPAAGVSFADSFKDRLFRYIGNKMTGMTDDEIATKMRITRVELADLERAAYMTSMPGQLDAVTEDDDDREGGSRGVRGPIGASVEDDFVEQDAFNELKDQVIEAISNMDDPYSLILRSSLEINGAQPMKPHQLAKMLRVSVPDAIDLKREAFRQLKLLLATMMNSDQDGDTQDGE